MRRATAAQAVAAHSIPSRHRSIATAAAGRCAGAIRRAVVEHAAIDPKSVLLDVGCGSGRLGVAFCVAGDAYVGVDSSAEMLRAFRDRRLARPPRLILADGGALPFGTGTVDALMFMHVLSARNWQALLTEAARVLRPHGVLVIGKAESPADGIDARMRRRLEELLAEGRSTSREETAARWPRG